MSAINNPLELMNFAQDYAKQHIYECAEEIIEWRNTCILRSGRVRAIATMIQPLVGDKSLNVAESIVTHHALVLVASTAPQKEYK